MKKIPVLPKHQNFLYWLIEQIWHKYIFPLDEHGFNIDISGSIRYNCAYIFILSGDINVTPFKGELILVIYLSKNRYICFCQTDYLI